MCQSQTGATVKASNFGRTREGQEVTRVDLASVYQTHGIEVSVITYGATLLSVKVPDVLGHYEEVTLQYNTLDDVITNQDKYYGPVCGRVANRIAKGKFELDGQKYTLGCNNGPNSLHGGPKGFDQAVWSHETWQRDGCAGVTLTLVSADGDGGYPGELEVQVTYSVNQDSQLTLEYAARVRGEATIVNLTNHAYWNLSGQCRRPVLGQALQLNCSRYLPVDPQQIPTGELAPVEDTPFDFRREASLAERIPRLDGGGQPGLDHCYVVDRAGMSEKELALVAVLRDPVSKRSMTVHGTQPGVQVYTANYLFKEPPHAQHYAICLETQQFPDAINNPNWKDSVILRPGQALLLVPAIVISISAGATITGTSSVWSDDCSSPPSSREQTAAGEYFCPERPGAASNVGHVVSHVFGGFAASPIQAPAR